MGRAEIWVTAVLAVAVCMRTTLAETAQEICGSPSESVSENIKGKLEGKAQTLARIGEAELKGEVEKVKNEIIVGANRADAARELHYLNYLSCIAIFSDKALATDQKLDRIRTLSAALNK